MASPSTGSGSIAWERGADGIVELVFDDPDHGANTMNAGYLTAMTTSLERLQAEREQITGVVLTSAKKSFFAGADLAEMLAYRPEDAAQVFAHISRIKAQLRALEQLGRPVVAAINGASLGGGFEIALACHHRILANVRGAVVGLPEVTLGLLPGAGGVTRTVRMLGIAEAVTKVLTTGRRFPPAAALELGLIDEVVDTIADLLPAARAWILANPDAAQPWDRPGFTIPGGTPSTPALAAVLPSFPALLRRQTKGAPAPAPRAILAAAVEGAQVDIDTAMTIETRYFVGLVTGPIAKNMIRTNFFDLQEVNAGASRPSGPAKRTVRRVGVLGAGMMGAGIAYAAAKAGVEVLLSDVDEATARRGRGYSERLVARAVQQGRSTESEGDALLGRITPVVGVGGLTGVDLVVEAVFESVDLKRQVFADLDPVVGPDTILASNTSSLPISTLAEAIGDPARFVGLHFFSPVDKMPLVEIIVGARTSAETLAAAFDFARQIGKTPIVVNDRRGFFTSRVIMRYLDEAVAAVGEGVEPASVEQAGLQAGYPSGPLQLMDELTLTLCQRIREEGRAAVLADGGQWVTHGSEAVVDRLVELGRRGRSTGAGFYDYDEAGRRGRLWPGLRSEFGSGSVRPPLVDLQERMLFAEAIEAVRCLDEGVLNSAVDANVGSLLGIGFPVWTGGVLRYIDSYPGGPAAFVARADELAEAYGEHFRPPVSLLVRADDRGAP